MFIWDFLKSELTSGQTSNYKESDYNQKRENVYKFLRLPWALEKVKTLTPKSLITFMRFEAFEIKTKLKYYLSLWSMGFCNVSTAFCMCSRFCPFVLLTRSSKLSTIRLLLPLSEFFHKIINICLFEKLSLVKNAPLIRNYVSELKFVLWHNGS